MGRKFSRKSPWIVVALFVTGTRVDAAGVYVALVGESSVAVGQEFVIRLAVTRAGDLFNAYDATIGWDPAKLQFLPTSPLSLQEGSYMTGACGATFHWFRQNATSVDIAHSLWCAGALLPGPGELYVLRFRVIGQPGETQVTIAANEFYAAGYSVPTARATPATLVIASPTDAPIAGVNLRLEVAPNPFNPATTLFLEAPDAVLQTLLVHDVAGRLVRTLDRGGHATGPRRVTWDGRDDRGNRLAAGTYWVTLEAQDRKITKRVVLLR